MGSERSEGVSPAMPIAHTLARLYWWVTGWRYVQEDPRHEGPRVLLGAPHTTNRDFLFMLAIAGRRRLKVRWLGKAELFRGALGPVLRALGGIPVDRSNPAGIVDHVVELVRQDPRAAIVVAPDGTRRAGGWRSGFYRIAIATGLPVTLGFVDAPTRTAGLGPTFSLTGDVVADMDRIRAFYADKHGVYPEFRSEPRLPDEAGLTKRLRAEAAERT